MIRITFQSIFKLENNVRLRGLLLRRGGQPATQQQTYRQLARPPPQLRIRFQPPHWRGRIPPQDDAGTRTYLSPHPVDINENEVKKLKVNNFTKEKDSKPKNKVNLFSTQAGFFDGGASATFEELLKALNKALSSADPQQASVILSHILEKKGLS